MALKPLKDLSTFENIISKDYSLKPLNKKSLDTFGKMVSAKKPIPFKPSSTKDISSDYIKPKETPIELFSDSRLGSTLVQQPLGTLGKIFSVPGALQSIGQKKIQEDAQRRLDLQLLQRKITPEEHKRYSKPLPQSEWAKQLEQKFPTTISGLSKQLLSESQKGREQATKGLKGVGKFAADVGLGAMDLATDIGVSTLTGVPLIAGLGVTGGAQQAQEAIDKGKTSGEALALGLGSGSITALVEGLGGVGGTKVAKNILSKATKGLSTKLASKLENKVIGNMLISALSEGTESAIEDVTQNLYKNKVLNENEKINVKQVLSNALLEGTIGGLFGGAQGTVNKINEVSNKKFINSINRKLQQEEMSKNAGKQVELNNIDNKINQATTPIEKSLLEKQKINLISEIELNNNRFLQKKMKSDVELSNLIKQRSNIQNQIYQNEYDIANNTDFINITDKTNADINTMNEINIKTEENNIKAEENVQLQNELSNVNNLIDAKDKSILLNDYQEAKEIIDSEINKQGVIEGSLSADALIKLADNSRTSVQANSIIDKIYNFANIAKNLTSLLDKYNNTKTQTERSNILKQIKVQSTLSLTEKENIIKSSNDLISMINTKTKDKTVDIDKKEIQPLTKQILEKQEKKSETEAKRYTEEKTETTIIADEPKVREQIEINKEQIKAFKDLSKFEEKLKKSSQKLQEEVAPGKPKEKIADVLIETPKAPKENIKEKIKKANENFRVAIIDSGDVINKISKQTNDKALYQAYNMAKQSQAIGNSWLLQNQSNVFGENVGESLIDIFEPIRKDSKKMKDFSEYLFHKHNIDRMKQDKPVFGKSITSEMSQTISDNLLAENPEFKDWSNKVYNYLQNLMQYKVDSGRITQEEVNKLRKIYPYYVPTYRVGANPSSSGSYSGNNIVSIQSATKKATGSNEDLLPLYQTIARMTMETIQGGQKNIVGRRLLYKSIINPDAVSKNITKIKSEDKTQETIDNSIKDGTILDEKKEEKNTFTIYDNGKKYNMTVSDNLFAGIKSMSESRYDEERYLKVFKFINAEFKKNVTKWNIFFAARNFTRDIQDAGYQSRDSIKFAKMYPKAWDAIVTDSDLWRQYQALGGFGSSIFDYDTGYDVEQLKKKNIAQKTINAIDVANFAIEQAPRFAEFLSVLDTNKTKVDSGKMSQMDALLDAVYAGAEVTTNFGRSGAIGKKLNKYFIPFFNPAIQGFSKFNRVYFQDPSVKRYLGLLAKIVVLGVAPSLLNDFLYSDDESEDGKEYANMSNRLKDTYYLIKVGDTWIKIPKGRAISVYGSASQRAKRQIEGDDKAWAGFVKDILPQVAPVDMSTILDPIGRMKSGKTWYGGEIEPQSVKNLPVAERKTPKTSVISIFIGKTLNVSPMKVEDLLDSYSGVWGDFILPMTSVGILKNKDNLVKNVGLSMLNVAGNNFTIDPYKSNQISQDYYDLKTHYNEMKTFKGSHYEIVNRFMNKQYEGISDGNKAIREIEDDNSLSLKEKQENIAVIRMTILTIQQNAMNKIKDYEKIAKEVSENESNVDKAYRETNRKAFGAEYALQVYSKTLYEKASSYGVNYHYFYNAYFAQKDYKKKKDKIKAVDKVMPIMPKTERDKIYQALNLKPPTLTDREKNIFLETLSE